MMRIGFEDPAGGISQDTTWANPPKPSRKVRDRRTTDCAESGGDECELSWQRLSTTEQQDEGREKRQGGKN
jgi:hypothetical protein